ncbi:MAG: hypothetical protein LC800_22970 [Acidobacteria bacterium]|nr:hypothetical protein [Acidobacteriota bacterium]
MSIADERPRITESLLLCREDLATDIEIILSGGPHAPDVLARLFITFERAIDSGAQGIDQTRRALLSAVEMLYLYSPAHEAALGLYLLSQQGELKIEDEPVNLINAAIKRTMTRLQPEGAFRKIRRG